MFLRAAVHKCAFSNVRPWHYCEHVIMQTEYLHTRKINWHSSWFSVNLHKHKVGKQHIKWYKCLWYSTISMASEISKSSGDRITAAHNRQHTLTTASISQLCPKSKWYHQESKI